MSSFADIQFKTGETEPVRAQKLRMLTDQIQLFAAKKASSTVPVGTIDWANITNKPTEFPPAPHEQPFSTITGSIDPSQVPEDAVTQYQSDLEINASQISGLGAPYTDARAVAAVGAASSDTRTISPNDTGGVLTWNIVEGGITIFDLAGGDPDILWGTDDSGAPTEITIGSGLSLAGGMLTTFGATSAAGVTFDDSDTLYDATNVQDALDWIDRGNNDQFETAGFDQRARIAAWGLVADSDSVQWRVDTGDGSVYADVVGGVGGTGPQGPPGFSGIDGEDGEEGPMGPPGPPGTPGGPPGPTGATGATGPTGPQGPIGLAGTDGVDGEDGQSIPGPFGPPGAPGAAGAMGPQGIPGEDGVDGDPGPPGMAGIGLSGATGPVGPQGHPGDDGAPGEDGNPGEKGAAGTPGTAGLMGPPGVPGDDGADADQIIQIFQTIGTSTPVTTLSQAILADSPFAFWKGDDAGTKLVDSSGNGFDLTTVNGTVGYNQSGLIPSLPSTLFARVGTLAGANGANGWQLTSQLGRTYPLTTWSAEVVFCPILNSGNYRILDVRPSAASSNAITLLYVGGTGLEFFYPGSSNLLTAPIPPSVPVHIVVTVSTAAGTSTITVYINGVQSAFYTAAASTLTGTMITSVGDIAASAAPTTPFYLGYMALFPTALSAARVAAHAAAAGKLGV